MKKKIKLFIWYFVYIAAFMALLFLILPAGIRQSIIGIFASQNDGPKGTLQDKYIILTFDDGWSSQYEAYKRLKPLNYKGTLYICSSFIGEDNRLTLDNLSEMYESGWDICNHTVHHVNLMDVSAEKANDEIYGCSAWIIGHGFTRNMGYKHFAYPEGSYDDSIIKILNDQGFLTARTTKPGNGTTNLLELGRTSLHGMTKDNIRKNILSDNKLIILCMHRIVPDDSQKVADIDLKESYFDEVISSIKDSKRQVITITEWYKLNSNMSK